MTQQDDEKIRFLEDKREPNAILFQLRHIPKPLVAMDSCKKNQTIYPASH